MESLTLLVEALFQIIDPAAIANLPWYIGVPGVLIIALSVLRAFTSLLRLRLIRAFVSLVGAIVIAIMLTNFGKLADVYTVVPS